MIHLIFTLLASITLALLPGDAPGIKNFSEIRNNAGFAGSHVGFGGATTPEAMSWLRAKGFATVISLRLASETGADVAGCRKAAEAAGMKYLHLPFDPENLSDTSVVEEILSNIGDKRNQPVYIHCNSATRVAALWMIGRVLRDGWDIDSASNECMSIAAKPPGAIAFATSYIRSKQ